LNCPCYLQDIALKIEEEQAKACAAAARDAFLWHAVRKQSWERGAFASLPYPGLAVMEDFCSGAAESFYDTTQFGLVVS
jgi:hypothetical protein